MNETSICRCCNAEKPIDDFYLRSDTGKRRTDCKVCFNASVLDRAKANPEQRRATQQAYVDRHRDRVRTRTSAHKKANRARINREQAARRARQPARERAYHQVAYSRYADRFRARRRAWYRANRERALAWAKDYARRPHVRERIRARAKERLQSDVAFALNHRMRVRLRGALLVADGKRGRSWERLVGYGAQELRAHLERQFVRGMSWENMRLWEIDHVVPLADFNIRAAGDAEFLAAWSLGNLRPLWRGPNRAKGGRRLHLL